MESPKVPASGELRFRVTLATRWSDEDNQNVLNNAVYMTLLEEARYAYFSRLALLDERHFPFLLAHTNIAFLAPGRAGAAIEVEPLPFHAMSAYPCAPDEHFPDDDAHRSWRAQWNTRPAWEWIRPLSPQRELGWLIGD